MRSVHELSDDELREELERTRPAYAEYVEDVGEHPTHATQDLGDGARRHLDVREELDRRKAGHHDDLPAPSAEAPDRDAGGQAGGGHVDDAEQAAARASSYADDPDRGTGQDSAQAATAGTAVPPDAGADRPEVPEAAPEDDRTAPQHENLSEKLEPRDIEPYA